MIFCVKFRPDFLQEPVYLQGLDSDHNDRAFPHRGTVVTCDPESQLLHFSEMVQAPSGQIDSVRTKLAGLEKSARNR